MSCYSNYDDLPCVLENQWHIHQSWECDLHDGGKKKIRLFDDFQYNYLKP